ncbi:beta-porphyranase A-like [Haliotis rufescens]|uniref:beta-porphyranase A-like n=1 Tax=Haliotis rufescens TaxID=6454 RepID=UPI00201F41BD|nr:beta-porphyranase A-like [Haliotis rufescens]
MTFVGKYYMSGKMKLRLVLFILSLSTGVVFSNTTVTIYPQWLAKGGNLRYEPDRWSKHNGLEQEFLIPSCRSIRTDSGRWMNRDLNDNLFQDWPEDPNHSGYPDPNYLKNVTKQQELFSKYLANINSGYKNEMIMVTRSHNWPNWMNQSEHEGHFPNNVDAAAEFMMLMVQGVYDYTQGQIPPYFEVINEPEADWQILNFSTTVGIYHKAVAEKLHARFNIKVAGPTITGYNTDIDRNDFSFWPKLVQFMDIALDHLDVFSFHSYNSLVVSGKSHRFTGNNEARLVAFVDLIESYVHRKKGKIIPLIISEYGRGGVKGISSTAPSGIVDFSTIYNANAHRFTQIGLREYVDRGVVFLLSNEQSPEHESLNWSLFTLQGKPTRIADVFEFWYNFTSEYSFIRTSSQSNGQERTVSPLAMSSPLNNETVILLHSYSQQSQTVKIVFQDDWITPTTGEATCITIEDNWNPIITFNRPFDIGKTQGMVELPPEATCRFTFKTHSGQLPKVTLNETTYYGTDVIIPIKDSIAVTTISLPVVEIHNGILRVSTSWPTTETNDLKSVTLNSQTLDSFFKLYDSDRQNSDIHTYMDVWEFDVHSTLLNTTSITVQVNFSNKESKGYVTSVALVTAKLVPSDIK